MKTTQTIVRVWDYAGETAWADLSHSHFCGVCKDGTNKPTQQEIDDGILAVVMAKVGDRFYGFLGAITGYHEDLEWHSPGSCWTGQGTPYNVTTATKITEIPADIVGQRFMGNIHSANKAGLVHYLLAAA